MDQLFIAIQAFNSQAFYDVLPEDYFDYAIVDVFHHATAPTYQKLLSTMSCPTGRVKAQPTKTALWVNGISVIERGGSRALLFVREFKTDMADTAPYAFLGTCNYVKHSGSRPMNITWKLDRPIRQNTLKKKINWWWDKWQRNSYIYHMPSKMA